MTTGPGHAARLAAENAGHYDVLVALGGDGTVSEVADGILSGARGFAPKLGVVPLGTGNDFAHSMGIADALKGLAAVEVGESRSVDVIEVRCQHGGKPVRRHVLLFAAVGIVTKALKLTTPTVRRLFGSRLAYPVGILRALWHSRAARLTVVSEQQKFEGEFLFVCASNSELAGGGMKIAPGAQLHDGLLDMNLIEAVGMLEALGQLRRLCLGRHIGHRNVRYFRGTSLEVTSNSALEVAADGELIGWAPARFEVHPAALQVLCGNPP